MNNHFGIKDLLLIILAVLTLVSVWLGIVQFDRQWNDVQTVKERVATQQESIVTLQNNLRDLTHQLDDLASRPTPAFPHATDTSSQGNNASNTTTADNGVDPDDQQAYFPRLMAPRDNPDFDHGDWFIDVFRQTVGKLTPLVPADAYQAVIERYVLEGLIIRDPDTLEWRPWIAHSWEVSDDGLTISFNLRRDVVFADNTPLTSADVVFTYDLIMNPQINAPSLRPYYENVESVVADGPYRVVFTLSEPYFLSLSVTGGLSIMPKHFYERFTPEQFNEMPGLLFGSGPYRLEDKPQEWTPGAGAIVLVRNENYWGPRPTFDRLVFREVPDENATLVAFRNGKIDRYGVTPERYERIKQDEKLLAKGDLYEYEAPNFGYRYIGWNQKRDGKATPFADKRVRQAMTLLTNRQEMAKQLMSGLATVATGPFHHLGIQTDPNIEPWPYDPERAKQLLADAGYADRDGDGVIEDEDGKAFSFKLIYPSSNENYRQMAFYLKDAFARAGIDLAPDPTEWNTMIQRIDERNFDAITLGWTGSIEGDPKQIFHSDSMAAGGSNYVSYKNEKLDQLIDTARATLDKDKRLAMWRQVHQLLHEDQPYTFLFFSKAVVLVDKRVKNVQIIRTGMNERTEWYVPEADQRWKK